VTGDENSLSAERVYHTPDMKNHHGDMVIVDGLVYGSNDAIFTCLELETGKVKWQNRSVGKGSVTFADGRIYLRSETGPIALIEPNGEAYREKGRFNQPDRSGASAWSHPVVAAGKLFLRDQDLLLCYDVTAAKTP
jgi:outer membrane protein assembly factor BamB